MLGKGREERVDVDSAFAELAERRVEPRRRGGVDRALDGQLGGAAARRRRAAPHRLGARRRPRRRPRAPAAAVVLGERREDVAELEAAAERERDERLVVALGDDDVVEDLEEVARASRRALLCVDAPELCLLYTSPSPRDS